MESRKKDQMRRRVAAATRRAVKRGRKPVGKKSTNGMAAGGRSKMKSKGYRAGGPSRMKSKGMRAGGMSRMKSKGMRAGGMSRMKSKGMKAGGATAKNMTLAQLRAAAKVKGYKLTKA